MESNDADGGGGKVDLFLSLIDGFVLTERPINIFPPQVFKSDEKFINSLGFSLSLSSGGLNPSHRQAPRFECTFKFAHCERMLLLLLCGQCMTRA